MSEIFMDKISSLSPLVSLSVWSTSTDVSMTYFAYGMAPAIMLELSFNSSILSSLPSVLLCSCIYIGETGRQFGFRINEHLDAWNKASMGESTFADHLLKNHHRFDPDKSVEFLQQNQIAEEMSGSRTTRNSTPNKQWKSNRSSKICIRRGFHMLYD